jgi:hypothetical protein
MIIMVVTRIDHAEEKMLERSQMLTPNCITTSSLVLYWLRRMESSIDYRPI